MTVQIRQLRIRPIVRYVIERAPLPGRGREGLVGILDGIIRPTRFDVRPAIEELVRRAGEVMPELSGEGLGRCPMSAAGIR